ncbi:RelA/SpoT family protein [Bailinhaonella thermotolerans]|uniref:Bifunctional (P)ppGpp synthetase/guanosine-3',5'-bis(Diphosphate) 3'-pyrophosphohydrolase n=1 Tax=Bailinhaonella thermotolerans TaxID=1070861 RepID=A0A3A4AB46_9ACTN|nr:HD domain-containing protein [Bailinhaonella thermotolerans]RJL23654.1 bifunctional (p)ppGpp synthetase/guanosine-3',5'-bis(diphosphate) 3'-pyrophosphohydrolase [Bailinhaonella thermotolerans]
MASAGGGPGGGQGGATRRFRAAAGRLARPRPDADKLRPAEGLLRNHRLQHPKADLSVVRRAYLVAERLHDGQLRKSGEPYVTHPLAVAEILADLGMDTPTIAAALLHDTVEDTDYTIAELRAEFGEEVAVLVDGVTKLDGSKWGVTAEAETFRKMILTSAADLRVLVIKLADRLHNLRTLGFQPRHKQERIARASLELLVPFAERLGMYSLKREMDDLCFASLFPEEHAACAAAVAAGEEEARRQLEPALQRFREALADSNVSGQVVLHRRHLYAIHTDTKGNLDGLLPAEMFRILVLVDGLDQECYVALGAVHAALHPIPGHLKDFIALPRFNMYRSLHTRVIDQGGSVLDVMIRSTRMHRMAEYGIAASIADAASASAAETVTGRIDLEWLRRLLAWQNDATSADFLESLRGDLRPGSIATFTPRGHVIPLPAHATPIDFAYALDPEIGNHAIGVLVNGRLAALNSRLYNGAVVEILTAPDANPSPEWLRDVKTPAARLLIHRALTEQRADDVSTVGRRMLAKAIEARGLELLDLEASGASRLVARHLGFLESDQMYAAVAANTVRIDDLVAKLTDPDL